MRKTVHLLALIFLAPFLFSATVRARDISKDRSRWLQSELNLSKDQKIKIKKILDEYRPEILEWRQKVDASKGDLRKTFRTSVKGKKHKKLLIDKFENSREIRTYYQRARFMMALEIRDVLNEEQIMKLNSLKEFKPKK